VQAPPQKNKTLCEPEEDYYKQMEKLSKGFAGELLLLLHSLLKRFETGTLVHHYNICEIK
jgi:hypothetical protein